MAINPSEIPWESDVTLQYICDRVMHETSPTSNKTVILNSMCQSLDTLTHMWETVFALILNIIAAGPWQEHMTTQTRIYYNGSRPSSILKQH